MLAFHKTSQGTASETSVFVDKQAFNIVERHMQSGTECTSCITSQVQQTLIAPTFVQDLISHQAWGSMGVVATQAKTVCLLLQEPDPVHQLPQHQPKQFDVCIANILQGPLLDLQPRLSKYVKPGGQLLLSGILTSQVTVACMHHI